MKDAKGQGVCTTDGRPGEEADRSIIEDGVRKGQQKDYVVLCDTERAKGLVRPYRDAYKHVGVRPNYPTRELTAVEHERYDKFEYVAFEAYPEGGNAPGRFWTAKQLNGGCGTVTTMSRPLAETWARDIGFYGATWCCGCGAHLPIEEFVWSGTTERMGI